MPLACERHGSQARFAIVLSLWGLFTSPLMLKPKSSSHLLLAWPVVSLLTTLSSPVVMPPSWPPPLPLSSQPDLYSLAAPPPSGHFFPKPSAWEIWGVVFTLTHSVHASLQPRAPLSDVLLVQHRLSILGMTPSAASYGRCLLRLGPERV